MSDRNKTLLIGTFVVVAIVIIAWFLFTLHPSVGDGKQIIHVRFPSIDKVTVGSRVTLAGRPIGEVAQITDVSNAREEPHNGHIYPYELTLHIDSGVKIFSSDDISLQTAGLLGEKTIDITPVMPPKGAPAPHRVGSDEIIYAKATDSVEEVISSVIGLTSKAEETMDSLNSFLQSNHDEFIKSLKAFRIAMEETGTVLEQVDQSQLVDALKEASDNFSQAIAEANADLRQLKESGFIDHLSKTATNLDQITTALNDPPLLQTTLHSIAQIAQDLTGVTKNTRLITDRGVSVAEDMQQIFRTLNSTKGTLGRLINSDDVYLQFASLLNNANLLVSDINNYGLLFTGNRAWQRAREQRFAALQELSTPIQFRTYMESEFNDISASVSRLSTIVEKLKESGQEATAVDNPEFRDDFAKLLKQVKAFVDTLNLYTQQLQHQLPPQHNS